MKDEPAPYYIEYEVDDGASTRVIGAARRASSTTCRGACADAARGGARRRLRVRQLAVHHARTSAAVAALTGDDGARAAGRRLRRHAPRDLAGDRRGVQARGQRVRQQEGGVPEPRGHRSAAGFLAGERRSRRCCPPAAGAGRDRAWLDARKQLSAVLRARTRSIESPKCSITETHGTRYYLNSEGFKTVAPIQIGVAPRLRRGAGRRRHDGARDVHARREAGSGSAADAGARCARAASWRARDGAARTAPVGEEFTGPVLLEGQASAEIVRADARAADAGAPAARRRQSAAARRGRARPRRF